jgi:predicted sulfurtransferase
MYCTGGVRCERASAYLKSKGIAKSVYQLEGGIHCYLEEYPDGHFRGKNFVFDARVSMATNDDVLAHCVNCTISCDNYTHCVINLCNKLMIMCPACIIQLKNTCSQECLHDLTSGNPIRYAPYKKTVSCEL